METILEESETRPLPPFIRQLVDLRDRQIQKARIQFGLRLAAIDRGADEGGSRQRAVVERYLRHFDALEDEIEGDIRDALREYPIYHEVSALRGIGPLLSAKLIALVDIHRARTVSGLWKFAGLAVTEGHRDRPTTGEKLPYSARLKTTVYLVGVSFLRSNSPYRALYDDARSSYERDRPDWTASHRHLAALRKMTKIFLSHLWVRWRTIEGLSVTDPWIIGREDGDGELHTHYIPPSDFGWPA